MGFTYDAPANVAGEWVNMRDLAKLGEPITTAVGFLTDDPSNTYQGDALPRYIVKGSVKSTGDEIKVSGPKGYGRDGFFEALDAYLKVNPTETVDIKFVKTNGSNYVDVTTAD